VHPFVNVNDCAVLVDSQVLNAQNLAFRATSGTKSALITGQMLKDYYDLNFPQHVILDFDSLAVDALASKVQDTKLAKVAKPQDDKEVQIGITVKKMEDFSTWYSQVVVRTEMLEYYDISGCYIIRPWGYNIWKTIQHFFGGAIEDLGVEDCYFPMFIPERNLNKEKDHVEGFSPEVAWVTKAYFV
jgi:prolyl-tRNA synthetase